VEFGFGSPLPERGVSPPRGSAVFEMGMEPEITRLLLSSSYRFFLPFAGRLFMRGLMFAQVRDFAVATARLEKDGSLEDT